MAFTSSVDHTYSAEDIVERLDPDLRDVTIAVRRTIEDGSISSKVDFTILMAHVPRSICLLGYSYPLIPAIPPPRRCFRYQRFRLISNQCRSSRHICEFCSEHHCTDSCPNKLRSAFCFNCCGEYMASLWEWPVYQYEFEVNKYCYWNCCGFGKAELGLRERGLLCCPKWKRSKPIEILQIESTSQPETCQLGQEREWFGGLGCLSLMQYA